MARFPEAEARILKNKFVCRVCKSVLRSETRKVLAKKSTCRRCGSHDFKVKRKK